MIKKLDHKKMGTSDLGWLKSIFHFSFAEYYNPLNMKFGVLRVVNDDLIMPHTGFDTHPHRDMEIISYVVDGELTHADNMGHKNTLSRGHVQYMSAGTGILHSEHNWGEDIARLFQIWILPSERSVTPAYGDLKIEWDRRVDQWLHLVSDEKGEAPVKINQDANIYVSYINKGNSLEFKTSNGRQSYVILVEGQVEIKDQVLIQSDAMEVVEEDFIIKSVDSSHVLVIEMERG